MTSKERLLYTIVGTSVFVLIILSTFIIETFYFRHRGTTRCFCGYELQGHLSRNIPICSECGNHAATVRTTRYIARQVARKRLMPYGLSLALALSVFAIIDGYWVRLLTSRYLHKQALAGHTLSRLSQAELDRRHFSDIAWEMEHGIAVGKRKGESLQVLHDAAKTDLARFAGDSSVSDIIIIKTLIVLEACGIDSTKEVDQLARILVNPNRSLLVKERACYALASCSDRLRLLVANVATDIAIKSRVNDPVIPHVVSLRLAIKYPCSDLERQRVRESINTYTYSGGRNSVHTDLLRQILELPSE